MNANAFPQHPCSASAGVILEDDFNALYQIVTDDAGDAQVDYTAALAADPRTVWTLVDADGDVYAAAGFHVVNRIGSYILTRVPWVTGDEVAEWFVDRTADHDDGEISQLAGSALPEITGGVTA